MSFIDSITQVQTITELALKRSKRGIFTRTEAAFWAQNSGARLDALLKRAVAKGEILRIVRGLYCIEPTYLRGKSIHPMELAQRIHGPSYISLETALSYHGCIPEGVHTLASASLGRSRVFDTPVGRYSYFRIPQENFFAGVRRVEDSPGGAYLMAIPLKALADLVYVQRYTWTSVKPVIGSLRIDEDALAGMDGSSFDETMSAYKNKRVLQFLAGLRKDLQS